jgi:aspartate beta-hydroxylase
MQAWTKLQRAARQAGHTAQELERIPEYLDYTFGLRRPAYPHALQTPGRYFPGLRAEPVWEPGQFEFLAPVVAQRDALLAEFDAHRQRSRLAAHHQDLHDAGSWNVLYLYAGNERKDAACDACPETTKAIKSVPGIGIVGQAYFSVLSGGTHIPAHCGPTNIRLRAQIRLDVPPGSEMRIGDQLHRWDDGATVLVFDDSFEHEVWVRGPRERVVFIFDFWHPDLTPVERWALELIDPWMPDRRRYRRGVRSRAATS